MRPMYTQLERAKRCILKGGVIAIPTETVYGVAANALNTTAITRIFEIKGRPLSHPLIVHVANFVNAMTLVCEFPEKARMLAERFWPGPLTLCLRKSKRIPDLVTGGRMSIAVRIPNHPLALELLRKCQVPLAAPSANLFGRLSMTSAEAVRRSKLGVDMILDGGKTGVGLESTIVSFLSRTPKILRPGGLTREAIESTIGRVEMAQKRAKTIAPGMLRTHYAPYTPLILKDNRTRMPKGFRVGLLSFGPPKGRSSFSAIEVLSASHSLTEAAANLYESLRRLDDCHLDAIVAERVPNRGLGLAINDRLSRASSRTWPKEFRPSKLNILQETDRVFPKRDL